MDTILKRSDKKAFYGIPASGGSGTPTFTRMRGFTEFSISRNPTEYSRRYVDEDSERTDVTGYSMSCSYAFDEFSGDEVHADIIAITDGEKVGADAQRDIVLVDFSKTAAGGGYEAVKRTFSVIADSEGDSTDAYTYSGNMRATGAVIKGTATIDTPSGRQCEIGAYRNLYRGGIKEGSYD